MCIEPTQTTAAVLLRHQQHMSLLYRGEPGSLVAVLGHDGHLLILPLGVKAAGQECQAQLLCDGLDLQGTISGAVR